MMCKLTIFFLFCLAFEGKALNSENILKDGDSVTLYLEIGNKAVEIDYKKVTLSENATVIITVTKIPSTINFVVFQVHTFTFPITLSTSDTNADTNMSTVNGTNIGLVRFIKSSSSSLIFYISNHNNMEVFAMVAAIGYKKESPVPGGCAMESPTNIAPYLDLKYTDSMITVKGGPSSLPINNTICDPRSGLKYIFQHMFLPEWDFSEETYFSSILKMMTYSSVTAHSSAAMDTLTGPPLQRSFSSYRGIGRVITVIVKSPSGGVSVYVPTFTYSCNTTISTAGCGFLMTTFAQIENGLIAFIGIFICFKGHKYFLINLFVMGTLAGTVVSYILLARNFASDLTMDYTLVATSVGIVFGIIWTSIWWCLHRPILSIIVPLFNFCCLTTAILFCVIRDFLPLFESDINYWVTFFSIALVLLFILLTRPLSTTIASCSFVGAYLIVVPIGIAVRSSIVYIFVNVIRRAAVEGFNLANTELPCQVPDAMLMIVASLLGLFGIQRQRAQAEGRPPFPPIPTVFRQTEEERPVVTGTDFPNYTAQNESSPLLGEDRSSNRFYIVFTTIRRI